MAIPPLGHNPRAFPGTLVGKVTDEHGNIIIDDETDGDITGDALTERMEYGVWNGSYPLGPEAGSGVEIRSDGIDDTKRLPYFDGATDVDGGSILFTHEDYAAFPSGKALVAHIAGGAAANEAYVQCTMPIGGDYQGDFADRIRILCVADAANTGTFTVALKLQYLDYADNLIGSEVSTSGTVAAGATLKLALDATTTGIAPTNARRLRVRQHVSRGSAAVTATGLIYFAHIRRSRAVSKQVFTSTGASTWYKPAGAQWVYVQLIGAGASGGSGRRGAAGSNRYGGGGGGGGSLQSAIFAAGDLPDTVTVTVGAGGPTTTGASADNTNGSDGTSGGSTTFGSYCVSTGGNKGFGGTNGSGVGGGGGYLGGSGGDGSISGTAAAGTTAQNSGGGAGGGGGGGLDTSNNPYNGGAGGVPLQLTGLLSGGAGAVGGSSIATAGSTPAAGAFGGTGGGGGAANAAGTPAGVRGGAAGGRGSGGGGGGAILNGFASGSGGAGGDGYCAVVAW